MKTVKKVNNNIVQLYTNNKNISEKPKTDYNIELIKVEQEIKSYLERVEFYIEEPNEKFIKSLQARRADILIKLEQEKSKKAKASNDSYVKKLQKELSKTKTELNTLTKKVNNLATLLKGTKDKLEKERQLRIKLHTRLQTYRQEIYRDIFESKTNDDNLDWVKEKIKQNPTWGMHKVIKNTTI